MPPAAAVYPIIVAERNGNAGWKAGVIVKLCINARPNGESAANARIRMQCRASSVTATIRKYRLISVVRKESEPSVGLELTEVLTGRGVSTVIPPAGRIVALV